MKRLLLILLLPLQAVGAVFYVDNAATGGNEGSDWANAWESFGDIVWASINPGDTLYISGGASSQTYTGALTISASGVTVRPGLDASYNGLVIISNQVTFAAGVSNVLLTGAKSDTFSTNTISPLNIPSSLTNNIGLRVDSATQDAVVFESCYSNRLRWVQVHAGADVTNAAYSGIVINTGADTPRWHVEIGYCYVFRVSGDGIVDVGGPVDAPFDTISIHHSAIMETADDGYEGGGYGTDFSHNVIGVLHSILTNMPDAHPDALVVPANRWRIRHNLIYTSFESGIRCVPVFENESQRYTGQFYIYGNLIIQTNRNFPTEMCILEARLDNTNGMPADLAATWTNVVMVNNTVAQYYDNDYLGVDGVTALNLARFQNNVYAHGSYSNLTWQILSNSWMLNNVTWGISRNGANAALIAQHPTTVNYNTIDRDSVGTQKIAYYTNSVTGVIHKGTGSGEEENTVYPTLAAFNAATGYLSNALATVTFADTNEATHDFRLASTDTGARNIGLNLSTYLPAFVLADMPDYDKDLTGQTRGGDGAWDRGALEYSSLTNGLLVWLEFEDDFETDDQADDSSGNSRHMLRYGYAADMPNSTNWPSRVTNHMQGSYSAEFGTYWDAPLGDGYLGRYGAITNIGTDLLGATNLTVALWVKWDWATNENVGLVDAGYGTNGGWHLGRNAEGASYVTKFEVYTNNVDATAGRRVLDWPDSTSNGTYSTNAPWWHYVVTVDCTSGDAVVNGYWHGTNIGSMTVTNIPHLTVSRYNQGVDLPWIGVSVNVHRGVPYYNGTQPNSGYLAGMIDDLRIYNRVLTLAEIAELAGEEAPAEEEETTPGTLTILGTLNATILRPP